MHLSLGDQWVFKQSISERKKASRSLFCVFVAFKTESLLLLLELVPVGFYIPIICSKQHFNCSNLIETSSILFQKFFWPFTIRKKMFYRSVNLKTKLSSHNFFQKTNETHSGSTILSRDLLTFSDIKKTLLITGTIFSQSRSDQFSKQNMNQSCFLNGQRMMV